MGCGCGGESNVYKPAETAGTAGGRVRADPPSGGPKIWNGPPPKVATKA